MENLKQLVDELSAMTVRLRDINRVIDGLITEVADGMGTEDACRTFFYLDAAHDAVDAERKFTAAKVEHLNRNVLTKIFKERLLAADVSKGASTTLAVEGHGTYRFTLNTRLSASMLDKEKAFEFLRDDDAGDMITESVHPQSLAKYAKEYLEEEEKSLPPEVFKVSTLQYVSATKKK